jgi:hypothetical protein
MIYRFSKEPVELQSRDTWRKDSRKMMVKPRKHQLHITKGTSRKTKVREATKAPRCTT